MQDRELIGDLPGNTNATRTLSLHPLTMMVRPWRCSIVFPRVVPTRAYVGVRYNPRGSCEKFQRPGARVRGIDH